jgi:hypothetical protein
MVEPGLTYCTVASGCRFSRDGYIAGHDCSIAADHSTCIEYHDPRACCSACGGKTPRTAVVEVGHMDHLSASSAACRCTVSFSIGERGQCHIFYGHHGDDYYQTGYDFHGILLQVQSFKPYETLSVAAQVFWIPEYLPPFNYTGCYDNMVKI